MRFLRMTHCLPDPWESLVAKGGRRTPWEGISGQGGCDCWSRVGDSSGRGQGGDVFLGTSKIKSQGTEAMHEINFW